MIAPRNHIQQVKLTISTLFNYYIETNMGRKQDQKKNPKHSEEQEEDVEQQFDQNDEQQNEGDENNYIDDLVDGEQGNIDGDAIMLQKIQAKITECDDEQKLTWGAIYQIKKQQADLNEQMQSQIDAIKQKYETLRFPLMNKIADAVSGKKLQKSLYSENQFTKSINLNKTKPKALKDYWGKVFEASGLVGSEVDIQLLQKLTSFKCDLIDVKIQHLKLTFQFEDNDYFENKIEIQVSGSITQGDFTKKLSFKAKGSTPDQNSMFGSLIAADGDDQQVLDTSHDLFRAYNSSTYFYFYVPKDEDYADQQAQQEQGDQLSEGQEQDDQSGEEDVKPIKKAKGSAITQKPQCKQQ